MDHSEFEIGLEFRCSDRTFRCTDVGSRVIVAIRVDEVELTTKHEDGAITHSTLSHDEAAAKGWFDGPPFAVAELVFDEHDLEACERA